MRDGGVMDRFEGMSDFVLPETFVLADGAIVPLAIGEVLYNYYDMEVVTIGRLPTRAEPCTMRPGKPAWWIVTTDGTSLDGSRMITLATARQKGWLT